MSRIKVFEGEMTEDGRISCQEVPVRTVSKLVRPPGSRARLGQDLIVSVLAVSVRAGGYVKYEVAWVHEGSRRAEWVEAHELEDHPTRERPAGYSLRFAPDEEEP